MVRISYNDIDGIYDEIKKESSGPKACATMLMVANEVNLNTI